MHSSPFSYLLLPLNSLCIAFSLSFSGVSSVLSQMFIKKTKQRVYSNVEVALHLVTEVGSPHRGTPRFLIRRVVWSVVPVLKSEARA